MYYLAVFMLCKYRRRFIERMKFDFDYVNRQSGISERFMQETQVFKVITNKIRTFNLLYAILLREKYVVCNARKFLP